MSDILTLGDPPITIHLRPNPRAKRYSLRISNKDGKISLTLPRGARMREATEFAQRQEGWMRKHLSKQLQPVEIGFGTEVLFEGVPHRVLQGEGRSVRLEGDAILIPGSEAQMLGKLRAFYKTVARDSFVKSSEYYAGLLNVEFGSVTLRDTRSRWGSCTSDGRLMYSWRLVMAPIKVQEYVAAHEVCHLIEMNHSAEYWALVDQIFPDYKRQRKWLKDHGAKLHQYQL